MLLCLTATCFFSNSAPPVDSGGPALQPDNFFNGHLKSWGVFQDIAGHEVLHFTMQANDSWQGNTGHMHESFTFSDGSHKERQWIFTKVDDRHFIGTAPDVVGEAHGIVTGNALHWVYTIILPLNGADHPVTFDDWLYLTDQTHMFSLVRIRKWGLPVGHMTMFFEKLP